MHDLNSASSCLLSAIISAPNVQPPAVPDTTHAVATALILGSATVLAAFLAVIVPRFRRERSPDSTVESHDSMTEQMVARILADNMAKDRELELAYEKMNSWRTLYYRLREAVRKHRLDPDVLLEEVP